ncbi:MAG: RNA 2',3'-cyclic phosphodiesterase [Akkermansiaceae bacterium]|nr:RNA 2',3'-cyclic phosphodiesterase [Armatimonadota bacterium]
MRLFTCLPLAPDIRDAVSTVQNRLIATGANIRWVEPENFHLTVSFIGDIADPSLLPEVATACASIAAETAPFRFRVTGVSVFPKRGDVIKTVLLTVIDGAEPWKELVRRSEPWLSPFGAKREGGLAAHVTLGRVKGGENLPELKAAIEREAKTDCGEQIADRIILMESVLNIAPAAYTERGEWRFTGV